MLHPESKPNTKKISHLATKLSEWFHEILYLRFPTKFHMRWYIYINFIWMSLQLRRNIYMPQLTMNYVKGAFMATKAEYIIGHFTHSAESGKLKKTSKHHGHRLLNKIKQPNKIMWKTSLLFHKNILFIYVSIVTTSCVCIKEMINYHLHIRVRLPRICCQVTEYSWCRQVTS